MLNEKLKTMKTTINENGQAVLTLTNCDNETVEISTLQELKELIAMTGDIEKVEIFYPGKGWDYLADAIRVKRSTANIDGTDNESPITEEDIEDFFEVWQTEVDSKQFIEDQINERKAIAIVLGTDDEGNFVSIHVWAANSVEIYSSYDLSAPDSKKWLSNIEVEEGKKYYSLTN